MPESQTSMPPTRPATSDTSERHVFVYGTLRRGDDNDITRLHPAPRWIGAASIQGRMYHLGRYPGVILGSGGVVAGEVYAISAELEARLDEIEEIYPQQHDEYFKRHIPVHVNGALLTCIVYEINARYVQGRTIIASGDWVRDR